MTDFPTEKKIILFDGVCNLCNNAVQTVIKYDTKNQYVFTSLQSETGKQILQHLKIDTEKVDSIILYNPSIAYYIKSSAAIKIMNSFSGEFRTLTGELTTSVSGWTRSSKWVAVIYDMSKGGSCRIRTTSTDARSIHSFFISLEKLSISFRSMLIKPFLE